MFASYKYELLYLSRASCRYNIAASVTIIEQAIKASISIRILGLHIDSKLKWGPYLVKIERKIESQFFRLTAIAKSI